MKITEDDDSFGVTDDIERNYTTEIDLSSIPENFDVELDDNGEINTVYNVGGVVFPLGSQTVEEFNDEDVPEEIENLITSLVKEWVSKDFIPIGEKTEVTVWNLGDRCFNLIGQVCTELGDDYDTDEWDRIDIFIHC
jgi:hypothetical protein